MQALGIIAAVYGIYGSLSILMQARKMITEHQSCDVSLSFLDSYVCGYVIWLAYGVGIHSMPIMAADGVGMVCGGFTLAVAVTMRRRHSCTVTKGGKK